MKETLTFNGLYVLAYLNDLYPESMCNEELRQFESKAMAGMCDRAVELTNLLGEAHVAGLKAEEESGLAVKAEEYKFEGPIPALADLKERMSVMTNASLTYIVENADPETVKGLNGSMKRFYEAIRMQHIDDICDASLGRYVARFS